MLTRADDASLVEGACFNFLNSAIDLQLIAAVCNQVAYVVILCRLFRSLRALV
jgi:hypothetical protein